MSGPTRPPTGGAPRQPWTPESAPRGVTCPACGLRNEPGVRTCRNCGLPIAGEHDPLRGVAPGSVVLPKAQRSGISATIGFVFVVGLLLVGGTLAVSGGGILSGGGRLVGQAATPTPTIDASTQGASSGSTSGSVEAGPDGEGDGAGEPAPEAVGTSFEYRCVDGAIEDLSKGRWQLGEVAAGVRSDDEGEYDQVYWTLTRQSRKDARNPATVTMEWTTPKEAQERFGIPRVLGNRALVITFDGSISTTAGQVIDTDLLEAEGIEQVRRIQLFEGSDGKIRTAIGLRGDSCARMKASRWGAKAKGNKGRIVLDIERVAS